MKKTGLCVYHGGGCNDGFAAALAVWMKRGDKWDYLPMQYGDIPTDGPWCFKDNAERYDSVMLVDFSLPRKCMEEMSKLTNLLVIDHHKTAKEACEGLDFCIFDLEKSGCELTWEYLFPSEECPRLLKCIGDRDLWKFNFKETKMVCAGLSLIEKDFIIWNSYIDDKLEGIRELARTGSIVLELQEKQVKDFVSQWKANPRFAIFPGDVSDSDHRVPIANCCELISEKIGALCEGYPFACGYFDTHDKRVFSLRARKGFNCSEIAKKYGGGGHPGASGFSCKLSNVDAAMSSRFFEDYTRFNG
jgi:uncharacterized protein